ncbi:coenzyme Q-binding protein COQ10 homolog, mitochondrial-like isoform X2 [Hibiscus syriacus]|uniref:coenzyme Q-binding protein COQ10 homolog, mitochondrial-like isoform X2 n=1 Tax=Hibiscus syriacus TaxID=106335 RepID=UPI00192237FA|nr:coenzyme Q-binding protein COQ10 homolog, mitochondrial-like isoform X2 [Hibiscus syriacus]
MRKGFKLSNWHQYKISYWIKMFLLIIRYSPEQLFDVVAAVDLYHEFVPWCRRSDIIKRYPDGSFDAELEIGFNFLVESYVSHVELSRPKFVKVASMFFMEVVSRMISSFSERCRLIYGPGVAVLENSYGERT